MLFLMLNLNSVGLNPILPFLLSFPPFSWGGEALDPWQAGDFIPRDSCSQSRLEIPGECWARLSNADEVQRGACQESTKGWEMSFPQLQGFSRAGNGSSIPATARSDRDIPEL